jgi:hypothetical protein
MLAWPRQTPIEEVLHMWDSFYASRFPSRPCVTPASDLRAPICRPRGIFLICKLKERNVTPSVLTATLVVQSPGAVPPTGAPGCQCQSRWQLAAAVPYSEKTCQWALVRVAGLQVRASGVPRDCQWPQVQTPPALASESHWQPAAAWRYYWQCQGDSEAAGPAPAALLGGFCQPKA